MSGRCCRRRQEVHGKGAKSGNFRKELARSPAVVRVWRSYLEAKRGMQGDKNAAKLAGFGEAEEELFTRICRVVRVAEEGVVRRCRRKCSGRKKGLPVAKGRQIGARCVGLGISRRMSYCSAQSVKKWRR